MMEKNSRDRRVRSFEVEAILRATIKSLASSPPSKAEIANPTNIENVTGRKQQIVLLPKGQAPIQQRDKAQEDDVRCGIKKHDSASAANSKTAATPP